MTAYIKNMNKLCFWFLSAGIETNILLTLIAIFIFSFYDKESFHYITAEALCTAAQKVLVVFASAAFVGDVLVKMHSKAK